MIAFNETMFENIRGDLESPYDLVRNKKWTLERFRQYATLAANLNGDLSYDPTNSNCTFGFTSYANFSGAAINGSQIFFTTRGNDGKHTFSLTSGQRFDDFAAKYAAITGTEGVYLSANEPGTEKHYETIFNNGRALFAGIEVKATNKFRNMKDLYGILPVPKYDDDQEQYYSHVNYCAPILIVPSSVEDPERAGIILDTLSHMSTDDVLPVYYDNVVCGKSLQSPDSVEMMGYIRDSRYIEPGLIYQWTKPLYETIKGMLDEGNYMLTSTIRGYEESIAEAIRKTEEHILE